MSATSQQHESDIVLLLEKVNDLEQEIENVKRLNHSLRKVVEVLTVEFMGTIFFEPAKVEKSVELKKAVRPLVVEQ